MRCFVFSILFFLFIPVCLTAQEKNPGPVIRVHGAVWKIPDPDFPTDTSKTFKVVFDIMNSPDSHVEINASIETAARFLNMHAQSGVPVEQLHVALVVHNKASKDILADEAYKSRYGTDNPNSSLVKELLGSGAEIIFCGQSSLSRKMPREETITGVKLSLSAMTAILQLKDEGYELIKF